MNQAPLDNVLIFQGALTSFLFHVQRPPAGTEQRRVEALRRRSVPVRKRSGPLSQSMVHWAMKEPICSPGQRWMWRAAKSRTAGGKQRGRANKKKPILTLIWSCCSFPSFVLQFSMRTGDCGAKSSKPLREHQPEQGYSYCCVEIKVFNMVMVDV